MSFIRYKYKIWHTLSIMLFILYNYLEENCDFIFCKLLFNIYDKHLGTKNYFILFF